ncbi:MAG: FeS cluster assembly protein SufD [Hyphomicrobiaceae bacterium hypho_1]
MTITIERTEAEKALVKHFYKYGAKLPGNTKITELRKSAIETFNKLGLPHRRIEEWKYTDLRPKILAAFAPPLVKKVFIDQSTLNQRLGPLAKLDAIRLIFVNGKFEASLSNTSIIDNLELKFTPISLALHEKHFTDTHDEIYQSNDLDPIVSLNTAFMSDGAALSLSSSPPKPIHIVHIATGTQPATITTRNMISVAKGIKATIVESFFTDSNQPMQINALTQLNVASGAEVAHIKIQRESQLSTHLSKWLVNLGAKSIYRGFQYSEGANLSRNEIKVGFKGANATADISGIDLLRDEQHCDTFVHVDHAEPECKSRELFKLVLDGCSRGIFQGKVKVHSRAQKTDGKQVAQALLLSSGCEFNSKPELEIYADDVSCGHGSTCAEIDLDLIFYFRSRGIPEATARELLIQSFVAESLEKIEDQSIFEELSKVIHDWFARISTY